MAGSKVYVTNNHSIDRDFPVEGGGMQLVKSGETEHFHLAERDGPVLTADARMGLITISDKDPKGAPPVMAADAGAKAPAQSPTGAKKDS